MKLYPQDLGASRELTIVCRRVRLVPTRAGESSEIGAWGRLWAGRDADDSAPRRAALRVIRNRARLWAAASVLPLPILLGTLAQPFFYPQEFLPALALQIGWAWVCTVAAPHALFQHVDRKLNRTPVTASEIAALLPQAHDELERSYLTLIMDVTRQDVQPTAEDDLRAALRALGDAIDRLPATRVLSDSPDIMTEVLRRTAAETITQAQAEPDRVVAASLLRRAEALHRRADATHRSCLLTRRFAVLRQEMAAETEALRAGLSAYYSGAHDIADLTRLAEDVRRVAAEAAAISAAVEEVDEALTPVRPVATPDLSEPRLHLGPG